MDIFELRDAVVGDYKEYVQGFLNIDDPKIDAFVRGAVEDGLLSPDPIVQLNPSYKPGEKIETLVAEGILHPDCAKIFQFDGAPMRFYKHQTDAIRRAVKGEDYILTTGTGSGKSMTYIVPIVNHILRNGSGKGVQAIIVYPMNALANSQIGELEKFLPEDGPFCDKIKFRRYTGQEKVDEKNAIRENPPDVILTNYMMLELLLTRASEVKLVEAMKNLKFFVLDEIHSYRGRQGADVAMLARRTLDAAVGERTQDVICVGTSATIALGKSREDDRNEVARVASKIFGKTFKSENIVGETLSRETYEFDFSDARNRDALRREIEAFAAANDDATLRNLFGVESTLEALRSSKLASWIETHFGTERDKSTKELVRKTPTPISGENGAAKILAELVELDRETCAKAIKFLFLVGANTPNAQGRSFFPFKLHQFVGRGENAYATAELGEKRRVFLTKQVYAPDSDRKAKLYPLAFCANCGQDLYSVERVEYQRDGVLKIRFDAREPFDSAALDQIDKENVGYLLLVPDQTKSKEEIEADIFERLPEEWKEEDKKDKTRLILQKAREKDKPDFYRVNKLGEVVPESDEEGLNVLFVPSPFRFCPKCNVAYPADVSARTIKSDSSHLSNLSVGGRSSATTLLALSTENQLFKFFEGDSEENKKKRKFLSFTDNRQDASLQAGHFNDFVKVCALRAALYRALQSAGDEGLTYENVAEKIVETLNLELKELDREGRDSLTTTMRNGVLSAFKKTIRYHVMRDLRRGWRYLVPNLEQTGLLKIEYADVDEIARDEERWKRTHAALQSASPQKRAKILVAFLDHLRRELAVDADELQYGNQEKFVGDVKLKLNPQWGFDEAEDFKSLYHAGTAYPRSSKELRFTGREKNDNLCVTPRSAFGSWLLRELKNDADGQYLIKRDELKPVVDDIFAVCSNAGLINKIDAKKDGYRLVPSCLLWKIADDKRQPVDFLRQYGQYKETAPVNEYFRKLYQSESALDARNFYAREHTAQVAPDEREKREEAFREGRLPILFCSPTMELGVDIAELNVVHMRNIPPTPANYAQRSGRAGRSGQPALSLVYATPLSQHDRYYFKRPEKVVSGAVAPPQIDLLNEALLTSHLYAIWLAEAVKLADFKLGDKMTELVDAPDLDDNKQGAVENVPKEKRTCKIRKEILEIVKSEKIKDAASARAKRVFKPVFENCPPGFERFRPEWIDEKLKNVEKNFKDACERWMTLYNTAFKQYCKQSQDMISHALNEDERRRARNLFAQARTEISLLRADGKNGNGDEKSEFYPYRYFAAEGFLPGYNFPRLPVFAYIPGIKRNDDEYLSRPRFLAISEFGPKAIVYHEGARYRIDSVSIPPSDSGDSDDPTISVAICPSCGYFHEEDVDVCENCGAELKALTPGLLELQKVVARRATRITCDEEERLRFGYAIATSYRFANHDGAVDASNAEILLPDGSVWGELVYGPAATIYRVNNGFKRQKPHERKGFRLDFVSGRWVPDKNDESYDESDEEEKTFNNEKIQFVRPFVRDTKNCVVVKPRKELAPNAFASLQAALQRAIERVFSVDDYELGAFPLPDEETRSQLLLYEASEGGAGALQRLLDPDKFQEVVREAFAVCHYNFDTELDLKDDPDAPNIKEGCEAACYDCLLSYSNQRDHEIIDRRLALDVLKILKNATLRVSSGFKSRGELLEELMSKTESSLEREWLKFIDENNWRLPTEAQREFSNAHTRVDFFYNPKNGSQLAVYIDGPDHDKPQQKLDDEKRRKALEYEDGVDYLVFRYDEKEKWRQIVKERSDVFFLE